MSVGERIRERLEIAGISQSELARRVQLTQPAINALIRGSSRTSLNLHKIARELGTTSAYLSGETDDPEGEVPALPPLSADQREWLSVFDALSTDQQRALRLIARDLAASRPVSGRLHDKRQDFRMPDQG